MTHTIAPLLLTAWLVSLVICAWTGGHHAAGPLPRRYIALYALASAPLVIGALAILGVYTAVVWAVRRVKTTLGAA